MCIVKSNIHVPISDLKSEINDEFKSVCNDIARNMSVINSVEIEISTRLEIFTKFCTVDREIYNQIYKLALHFSQIISYIPFRKIY